MCSGDNLDTAKAVAVDAGILTEEEVNSTSEKHAMSAQEFREIVGDVVRTQGEVEYGDESTITYSLTNQQGFNQIIGNLKVIGRAEPEDKLRLIAGLKGMNDNDDNFDSFKRVACVGEGINDIEAFEAADVSFAVQDGTSYARNKASMILLTNDFDSCMRAVMWGRNIQLNVQRFL
jgi:magnesium-transporting ATPase (P-type)